MPAWNGPRTAHNRGLVVGYAPAAGVSSLTAFFGDSLTAHHTWCPHYWTLGLLGAPLDVVRNGGFNGQSILGLSTQLDTSWDAAPAGLSGAPALGWIFLRIGSNNARGAEGSVGVPLGSYGANYDSVITKCLAAAEHVVIFPVPPIGGDAVTKNLYISQYNDYLQAKVAANPTRLHWIDDCADLTVPGGAVDPTFFIADELHFSGAGMIRCAQTAQPQLVALFAEQGYASALITDAADVYPAQPQWVVNPLNTGTSGTRGSGWTGSGSLPTGVHVASNGAGMSGTADLVAADGGDANTTPWLRITPSASQSGSAVAITYAGDGRSYGASDPAELEQTMEVRVTGWNGNAINRLRAWMQAGGQQITAEQILAMNEAASASGTVTLRHTYKRPAASSGVTGVQTTTHYIYLDGAGSSPAGTIDIRCLGVRG